MMLALRELRRRPNRFVVAAVILTLIALLLTFLGALLDGLVRGSTGALRLQDADAIVFAEGADASLVRSRVGPDVRAAVEDAVGADRVGALGSVQLGARLPGRDDRDLVPTVLFGYELAPRGLPRQPPAAREVIADSSLRSEGVEEGTVLRLGPARSEVTVVGFVDDSQYAGQGSLWGSTATWREVLAANRPGATTGEGTSQALVIRAPAGEDAAGLPEAVDEATGGATDTYTIAGAIDALPGVSQQRTVFNQIIALTVIIAVVVVALFFALLTVERTALYGVLKALGAGSAAIFGGVVLQALIVTALAVAVGVSAGLVLDAVIPEGSIPFAVTLPRLVSTATSLVLAAVVGCAFSLRRVLRIDPASAIGRAQ
jgi:putative ABC transport system permease protein